MRLKTYVVLGFILAVAFILRIWGTSFGLPGVYHPDEERLVHHALAFGLGDLNPHYFNYPSLAMYVLFFQYGIFYMLGLMLGWFSGVGDFQKLFFTDPSAFYLIGRITSAVLGTVTVYLIYRLGRKAYSRLAGLFAAWWFALVSLHLRSSHFICTDILLNLFIVWAYLEILAIFRQGRIRSYVLVGILAGIGAASKYNAALLIIPIFLAHLFRPARPHTLRSALFSGKLWLAGVVMLGTFFICSPFVFLDFGKFWSDFQGISEHMRIGVYGTGGGTNWLNYAPAFFSDLGYYSPARFTPLGLVCLGGVLFAFYKHRCLELLLIVFPLVYFVLIGSWGVCNLRYLIPVYPGLMILGGGACSWLWRFSSTRPFRILVCVLWVMLSIPALLNAALSDRLMARTDTRSLAKAWIEDNFPSGSTVALEWDNNATVQLSESRASIEGKVTGYEAGELSTIHHPSEQMAAIHRMRLAALDGKGYNLVRLGEVNGLTLVPTNYDLEALHRQEVEYLVLSRRVYGWFEQDKMRAKYPSHARFYENIFSKMKPIKTFARDDPGGPWPGPAIRIYRLSKD